MRLPIQQSGKYRTFAAKIFDMQFNSFVFLLFLPVVFLLYWQLKHSLRWQNVLVVVSSYVFYGWWDARFLLLIAMTSLLSYGSGVLMERLGSDRRRQKAVCVGNVAVNLAILAVFKYYNFFAENLALLLQTVGIHVDWVTLQVVLPVGISFYTFQALSYTVDVYRGEVRATHDVVAFLVYISFFPQLVAGPIERATRLLPQFLQERRFDYSLAVSGCRLMLWGFFKKMVIADNCAVLVNSVWDNYATEPAPVLLIAAVLFTFQIYGDFSGYSDIAIGCARLFGIRLMRNFHFPYFAASIADFWRRWHISLTTWLRDYVYIPLGGSRQGLMRTLRNTFIVWGISGLWHGANWTFVCWGLYHALLLSIYRLTHLHPVKKAGEGSVAATVSTFALVVVGWIIFRATSMSEAMAYIGRMMGASWADLPLAVGRMRTLLPDLIVPLGAIALMMVMEWRRQHGRSPLPRPFFVHTGFRYGLYVVVAMLTIALAGSQSEFIYFQF